MTSRADLLKIINDRHASDRAQDAAHIELDSQRAGYATSALAYTCTTRDESLHLHNVLHDLMYNPDVPGDDPRIEAIDAVLTQYANRCDEQALIKLYASRY